VQAKTPIALFVYNRPQHTARMLSSLEACSRLSECQIVMFSDAPRVMEHASAVQEVRNIIREWAKKNGAERVEQTENLGLAHSIVDGVTRLCSEYGRVIVVEDDLILHPAFLDFMLQSLNRYSEEERVAQIAGFTFPVETPDTPDAFFLPLTTSWGWATWKRAWDLFSWDIGPALAALSADSRLRARFDLDGSYPYYEMLRNVEKGQVDSWAIRWHWITLQNKKLTLYPRRSLVWQNGFDDSATHTGSDLPGFQQSLDLFFQSYWSVNFEFPEKVSVSPLALNALKKYLSGAIGRPRTPSWLRRIYDKLRH
jgi:hypothetical protein